jgi:hypothetical protein
MQPMSATVDTLEDGVVNEENAQGVSEEAQEVTQVAQPGLGDLRAKLAEIAATSIAKIEQTPFRQEDIEAATPATPAIENDAIDFNKVDASMYFALGIWVILLLTGYGFGRMCCWVKIPGDCTDYSDIVSVMQDFHNLLFMGFFVALAVGIVNKRRFTYLFRFTRPCPRGFVFISVYFISIIGWGLLDYVPGLREYSITSDMSPFSICMLSVTVLVALLLVAWHFWYAFWHNSWKGLIAYVLTRLSVAAWFVAYIIISSTHSNVSLHVHHYLIAFAACTLAAFNHPLSVLLLAISLGVFVQGISAYNADPIIHYGKFRVEFNSSGQLYRSPLISKEAADWFVAHWP